MLYPNQTQALHCSSVCGVFRVGVASNEKIDLLTFSLRQCLVHNSIMKRGNRGNF